MHIAIVTTGRFYVLDLARELDALGHNVLFYSYVPRWRAEKFGLSARCHRPLLPIMAPLVALRAFASDRLQSSLNRVLLTAVDHLVARILRPCDVFIGMSGLCIASARAAKIKHGAKVVIDRGSRHILSQREILESIQRNYGKRKPVPDHDVARELASYALADVIAVPSLHAEQSFLEYGMPKSKLFRNPYGVDLSMFPPTPAPPSEPPTILFVGSWSFRKGCDVLTEAWRMLQGTRLIHVGSRGDAPMPDDPGFTHIEPVPQWKLREYYAQAHVFILASREDGFGLVLAQALACGLPVVYTDRTGGEDLAELAGTNQGFYIVPHGKAEPLADGIRSAMLWAKSRYPSGAIRNALGESRASFSWKAYGKRYSSRLMKLELPKML